MTNYEWLLQMGGDERKAWFDAERVSESEPPASQNVSEKPGALLSDLYGILSDKPEQESNELDSREMLEADVRAFANVYYTSNLLVYDKVIELLDRQAAITWRECREYEDALRGQHHKRVAELKTQVDSLTADLHASNREREHLRRNLGIALDHAHDICSLVDLDGNVLP